MQFDFAHSCGWRPAIVSIALAAVASLALAQDGANNRPQADVFPQRLDDSPLRVWSHGRRVGEVPRDLTPGSKEKAEQYYQKLAVQLELPGNRPPAALDGLFDYYGYRALKPADANRLPAEELTNYKTLRARYADAPQPNEFAEEDADWDVLAASYFAPKTSDVSGLSNKVSWRKAVRLKALPGSDAEKNGMQALYFLSVVYVARDHRENPFQTPSVNIQVMLTRAIDRAGEDYNPQSANPSYWLLFDPREDYKLSYSTTTSWDAADPALTAQSGVREYFVPTACQQCHGGRPESATPHFFDTDYTLDRVQPGDDFHASVGQGPWGALFECGKDPQSDEFHRGFEAFRKLNGEILAHNQAVKTAPLHTAGAENWMRLHADSDRHAGPLARAWPGENGWKGSKEVDRHLLPLLNRFCYRCHGTIYYSVYDRETVAMLADYMLTRLTADDAAEHMPLDRDLEKTNPEEFEALKKWLGALAQEQAAQ